MRERAPLIPLVWLALAVASCGHRATTVPPSPRTGAEAPRSWLTRLDQDHPLVGRVWSTARQALVDEGALLGDAARARFVLLGEKHDNPDHHRLQAQVIAAMIAAGRRPSVALEMLETNAQGVLDAYRATHPTDAAGLGEATGWPSSGWPPWPEYLPIVEVAVRNGLPIVAANLPRAQVRELVHGATDAATLAALGLDRPLPAEAERALREELVASHCGHLGERMVGSMLLAQRARDARMAERLRATDRGQGGVLIAGAGHVRLDRGVPWYLRRQAPEVSVLSVAFVEVDRARSSPREYERERDSGGRAFDYLWFTPRANDDDPCAALLRTGPPR